MSRCLHWCLFLLAVGAGSAGAQDSVPAAPPAAPRPAETGWITGRVTDSATGLPLPDTRLIVDGQPGMAETNADGRYRTGDLPPGVYSIRAAVIGYGTVRQDSIRVVAGTATVANFELTSAPVALKELVTESAPLKASSEAGLLSMQKEAPTVMDGISAESMSRSPDSDASDAIARVTGASVVGDKFVYVRGLGERYGNTLLNGAELPSPEPLKKVVPLDLFPASLLQSIVTTKSGRPDRPGDVTGAGVEIETKDFPATRVLQVSMTQEYNGQTTFKTVARGPRGGTDLVGFDDGRRTPDGAMPDAVQALTPVGERFAESFRTTWAPAGRAPLNLGMTFNVGGTIVGGDAPLGGVLALNYSAKTEHTPDRLYQLTRSSTADDEPVRGQRYSHTSTVADWGGIFNVAKRLGASTQLSWRNLYSRNAEEMYLQYAGYNHDNSVTDNARGYQVQYVERDLLQTQLAGKHYTPWLFGSRLEWRGSLAWSRRDEPENRNVLYTVLPDGSQEFIRDQINFFFVRFLRDRMRTGQVDWAVPLSLWQPGDAELKVGVMRRQKRRQFNARTYTFETSAPVGDPFLRLPPDLLFAPENIGGALTFAYNAGPQPSGAAGALDPTYHADDDMTAGYVMADLPMYPWLRMVGGLRVERWHLLLDRGDRGLPAGNPVVKNNTDALWSANLTFRVGGRTNVRVAGYRSVARPEARELDEAYYVPVGGDCGYYGDSSLVRTTVTNGDVRWEHYPSSGEIVTVGGFYKDFAAPIFEEISFSGVSNCSFRYRNAESATVYGLEAEFRKRLDFVGLPHFMLGMNVTYVKSEALVVDSVPTRGIVVRKLPFVGQSPYLLNLNLSYTADDGGFSGTALLNYFDDRATRYGDLLFLTDSTVTVPNVVERGRTSLDVKLQRRLGRMALSGSGKNLLHSKVRFVQEVPGREFVANAYDPGVSFSLGIGYDF